MFRLHGLEADPAKLVGSDEWHSRRACKPRGLNSVSQLSWPILLGLRRLWLIRVQSVPQSRCVDYLAL